MEIRPLSTIDSLEELTHLIHAAYRQLADMGFKYWATYQSVDDTRQRIAKGMCYVATEDGALAGTIVLNPPGTTIEHPWYDKPGVAVFHQFAVHPEAQGQGLGSRLMDHIEQQARTLGATELACDTAEGAVHLIAMYEKRGFRIVAKADWDITNYESVILSKALG